MRRLTPIGASGHAHRPPAWPVLFVGGAGFRRRRMRRRHAPVANRTGAFAPESDSQHCEARRRRHDPSWSKGAVVSPPQRGREHDHGTHRQQRLAFVAGSRGRASPRAKVPGLGRPHSRLQCIGAARWRVSRSIAITGPELSRTEGRDRRRTEGRDRRRTEGRDRRRIQGRGRRWTEERGRRRTQGRGRRRTRVPYAAACEE